MRVTPVVPVTVLGGFLGSGKTSLLNCILHGTPGIRYAVMVNDFGSLAIDEALIQAHDGETISFANGCVCCSMGDNLLASIDKLLQRSPVPEQFLIEISGVGNPKTIADVATLHPRLRPDLVISLADAETVLQRLTDSRLKDTLTMQLKPADLIVLNKCDLVSRERLDAVRQQLQQRFAGHIVETTHAALPADVLSATRPEPDGFIDKPVDAKSKMVERHPEHLPEQQFHRLSIELPRAIRRSQLVKLLTEFQSCLLRAKGFVYDDSDDVLLGIQLSGKQVDVHATASRSHELCQPVLVAIGSQPLDDFAQAIDAARG